MVARGRSWPLGLSEASLRPLGRSAPTKGAPSRHAAHAALQAQVAGRRSRCPEPRPPRAPGERVRGTTREKHRLGSAALMQLAPPRQLHAEPERVSLRLQLVR